MEATRSSSWTPEAVAMPVLAGAGALMLGIGDAIWTRIPDSDGLPTALFVLGWLSLVSATVLGVVVGTHLVHGAVTRRSPTRPEVLIFFARVAVIAVALVLVPPAGSGSGSA